MDYRYADPPPVAGGDTIPCPVRPQPPAVTTRQRVWAGIFVLLVVGAAVLGILR